MQGGFRVLTVKHRGDSEDMTMLRKDTGTDNHAFDILNRAPLRIYAAFEFNVYHSSLPSYGGCSL